MSRSASFDIVKSSSTYSASKVYKQGEYFSIDFIGNGQYCTYLVGNNWSVSGIQNDMNSYRNTLVSGVEYWLGYIEVGGVGLPSPSGQSWDFTAAQIALASEWYNSLSFRPAINYALTSEGYVPPIEILNIYSATAISISVQRLRDSGGNMGIRFYNNSGSWVSGQGIIFMLTLPAQISPF